MLDVAATAPLIDARPAAPALSADGVVKRWAPGAPPVLAGVDLRLEHGTALAISGRNGAGKTTLLRIVAGMIAADEGAVRVCGLDPERDRARFRRSVGFLSAGNGGLYARLKAEHHLDLAARLALMPRDRRRRAAEQAVGTFGLEPLLGRRVDRLSMGQRQRLRLALAFLHGPSLVLLDEPTTSLDEDGIGLLRAALDDLVARGGSAIVCLPTGWDHQLRVDRSAHLELGRLESQA